jgi:hypothetical protein
MRDFRVIPLGDLNLVHRIGSGDGPRLVGRRQGRASQRRMYTARIHGFPSSMTVVVYQGHSAEEVRSSFCSKFLVSLSFAAMAAGDQTIFRASVSASMPVFLPKL